MSSRPPLEAVVFDAGGTLIRLDFEWMAEDLARHGHAAEAAGLRLAEIEGRRAYDASGRPVALAPRVRGDVRAYFRGGLAAAGVPSALIDPAVERFLERERTHGIWCRPMEGARAALEGVRARGLRAAVVSNSDGRAESHLVRADMLHGIEFVVDSHLVGIEKPDPAIFAVALARLGTAAERTLFVGDIRSVDEAGAAAAGMRFVLIDPTGAYAGPGTSSIAGMHDLVSWLEATFELPRTKAQAPSSVTSGRSQP